MKALILTLALPILVVAQTTRYDKFTDTTFTLSKEVEVYRNRGGVLVYNPASVRLQMVLSDKSSIPVLGLTVSSFDWQFARDCEIRIIADARRETLPCKVVSARPFSLARSVYVREVLTITSADLIPLLNSKSVSMQVGSYEFEVKEKHLETLRAVFRHVKARAD